MIEIKNRYTGVVIYASDSATDIGHAVREAIDKGLLFQEADFEGATFWGATFEGATFKGATFKGATFEGATFWGATFEGATFWGATFKGATFKGATFEGATFEGATFKGATFKGVEADLRLVLALAGHREVETLLAKIRAGEIEGSTYEGPCACLVGTLANARGCKYDAVPGLKPDSDRPAERFFLMISMGHTPANSPFARLAESWIEKWLAENPAAVSR